MHGMVHLQCQWMGGAGPQPLGLPRKHHPRGPTNCRDQLGFFGHLNLAVVGQLALLAGTDGYLENLENLSNTHWRCPLLPVHGLFDVLGLLYVLGVVGNDIGHFEKWGKWEWVKKVMLRNTCMTKNSNSLEKCC